MKKNSTVRHNVGTTFSLHKHPIEKIPNKIVYKLISTINNKQIINSINVVEMTVLCFVQRTLDRYLVLNNLMLPRKNNKIFYGT